jgi:phage baseplate assembly protein W
MTDFGTDLTALPELRFQLKDGLANLGEALARRLLTPRGGLFYDPTYGWDLRRYLNEVLDEATEYEMKVLVEQELEKDPRVYRATVEAVAKDLKRIYLDTLVETAQGPFRLTVAVSDVSVEVLRAQLA